MVITKEIKIKALQLLVEHEILTYDEYLKCKNAILGTDRLKEYKKDFCYLDKEPPIWNNEFVRVSYRGIIKQGNYWGLVMFIENKTNKLLSLRATNVSMGDVIVCKAAQIINDLPKERKILSNVAIRFEDMEGIGINEISKMSHFELRLSYEVGFKTIAESETIILEPIEYKIK